MIQIAEAILALLGLLLIAWEVWAKLIKPHMPQIEKAAQPALEEARKGEAYAVSVFHRLEPQLKKELHVITQDEEAIVTSIKGLLSGKAAAESTAASEKARADAAEARAADLQSQLDTEKANHADLVSQLQGVLNPAPAAS